MIVGYVAERRQKQNWCEEEYQRRRCWLKGTSRSFEKLTAFVNSGFQSQETVEIQLALKA